MYAIVKSGGKQFRVHSGDLIRVEQRAGEIGDQITFDQVLLVGDAGEQTVQLGRPVLTEARVVGTITEQRKGDKIRVFRFKRRKRYRKIYGHRQPYTGVKIEEIQLVGTAAPTPAKKKAAKSGPAVEAVKSSTTKETAKKPAPKKTTKKATAKKATKKTAETSASAHESTAVSTASKRTPVKKKATAKKTKASGKKSD